MTEEQNLARLLREGTHLPIGDLARRLGVSRQAYYKWLNGGSITPEHLTKLEEILRAYQAKGFFRGDAKLSTSATVKNNLDLFRACGIIFR